MTQLLTVAHVAADVAADRIIGALRAAGMKQRDVASHCSVSEGTVSKILRGKYPLRSVLSKRTRESVLELVSAKTGISIEELRELTAAAEAA